MSNLHDAISIKQHLHILITSTITILFLSKQFWQDDIDVYYWFMPTIMSISEVRQVARSLRFLLHLRWRRNYTLSPTLLLTCTTKITLNIHHNQPIEACYIQSSCFYKEIISLHLTLPRSLRFVTFPTMP